MSEQQVAALAAEYPDVLQLIQDGLSEAEFVAHGQHVLGVRDGRPVFAFFAPQSRGLLHYDAAFAPRLAALVNAGIFWPLSYVPDAVVNKLLRQADVSEAAKAGIRDWQAAQ